MELTSSSVKAFVTPKTVALLALGYCLFVFLRGLLRLWLTFRENVKLAGCAYLLRSVAVAHDRAQAHTGLQPHLPPS
jgi:hypothetical protein